MRASLFLVLAMPAGCCDPYPLQQTVLFAAPQTLPVAVDAADPVATFTVAAVLAATGDVERASVTAIFVIDEEHCDFFGCPRVHTSLVPEGDDEPALPDDADDSALVTSTLDLTGACEAPCEQEVAGTIRVRTLDGTALTGALEVRGGASYVTPQPDYCTAAAPPPAGDTFTLDVQAPQ